LSDEQTAVACVDPRELELFSNDPRIHVIDHHNPSKQSGPFDTVFTIKLIEYVSDIPQSFSRIRASLDPNGRMVVFTFSRLWQPLVRLLTLMRLRTGHEIENWVPPSDLINFLELADFEMVTKSSHVLVPFEIPIISRVLNRWVAPLPLFRSLCFVTAITARPRVEPHLGEAASVSIVIAARNEAGHIPELLDRIPHIAPKQEVILVEGGSEDNTWEVIEGEIARRQGRDPHLSYRLLRQPGKGKADAIRHGFEHSSGDILVILDADISVPPEELGKFTDALVRGHCRFANGSRLVYSMEKDAMRFLNLLGNRFFGSLFTFLIGQPIRDTLCGTKAMWKTDYERIVANRDYFGDFDPFGDFDLLFGAARLGIRIRDVPIHYKARSYGSTNISRFRHGFLLFRMSGIAARKIRFPQTA